jgi:hypothetical protein
MDRTELQPAPEGVALELPWVRTSLPVQELALV